MPDQYSIKINRRDGALEITGPEREWVDTKLEQLEAVYSAPLHEPNAEQLSAPDSSRERTRRRPKPRPATRKDQSENGAQIPAKPARARRVPGRPQRNPELEAVLTREVQTDMKAYIDARSEAWAKKQTNQAAIVATFLRDEVEWPGLDEDDIYTVYRLLGLDAPGNLRSLLQNAYARDKYFTGMSDGKYTISLTGENFARKATNAERQG